MKVLAAGGAGLLALIVLAAAIASSVGTGASSLSPAMAGAPPGLVALAFQAGPATGIDPNVLLAIAKVETNWGQARNGQPDDLVPDDIRATIDAAALQPAGATATLLGLKDGRRIGDWVNPQPVNGEHAMGLMQFPPSTWRVEAAAAPGQRRDPYLPADALLTAGSYLHRLQTGAADGVPHDLRGALAVYGGSLAYADQVLSLAEPPAQVAGLPVVFPIPAPGWVQGIATPPVACRPGRAHEPVRRHEPVRARRAGDLGPDAPGRSALEPPASAVRQRTCSAWRGRRASSSTTSRRRARWWSTAAPTASSGTSRRCGRCRATATRSSSRTSWTSIPTWSRTGRRSTCGRWRGRIRRRAANPVAGACWLHLSPCRPLAPFKSATAERPAGRA